MGLLQVVVHYGNKISHCKFDYTPNKSTLFDANKRRDYKVFLSIYWSQKRIKTLHFSAVTLVL